MNQTLSNIKKVIEKNLNQKNIDYDFTEEKDSDTEPPVLAYSTEHGFGMFSDRNSDDTKFFIMTKTAEREEESEYVQVKLATFIDTLSGKLTIKDLLGKLKRQK